MSAAAPGPHQGASLSHRTERSREDAGAGGRYETLEADRTRETVALPLPECVALGMSCRPVSLGLSFLKVKAVWLLPRRVSVSIHYEWLLLLLLSLPSSSSDRQAKSLRPRTQNCSGFEHSSFGAATSGSKGADREVPVKTSGEKPIRSRWPLSPLGMALLLASGQVSPWTPHTGSCPAARALPLPLTCPARWTEPAPLTVAATRNLPWLVAESASPPGPGPHTPSAESGSQQDSNMGRTHQTAPPRQGPESSPIGPGLLYGSKLVSTWPGPEFLHLGTRTLGSEIRL